MPGEVAFGNPQLCDATFSCPPTARKATTSRAHTRSSCVPARDIALQASRVYGRRHP